MSHKISHFQEKCQFCMFVKDVALLREVTVPQNNT